MYTRLVLSSGTSPNTYVPTFAPHTLPRLQLDVKGCKNIYDSFDRYCEVETMDGANQYNTDTFGLQVGGGLLSVDTA